MVAVAEDQELRCLRRGPLEDPAIMNGWVETAAPRPVLPRVIPAGIPFVNILGLNPSASTQPGKGTITVVPARDRIWAALLLGDV